MMKRAENRFIVLVMIIFCFTGGCTGMNTIKYQYADGSGNLYKIQHSGECSFEYFPVKPHQSSSGEYDGGDSVSKKISGDELKKIIVSLEKAINNSSIHIKNRVMGSGLIIKSVKDSEQIVIIHNDAQEKTIIELSLKECLK